MRVKRFTTSMICCVATLLLLVAPALAGDVHLSVAASLREVITELTATYGKKHPSARFFTNFGASGALAKQIENSAPGDIFISANEEWLQYLKTRKLVDQRSVRTFTSNTLVFAGSAGAKVDKIQDVTKLDRIAIGSPASVPAGEYAKEALVKAGLWKTVEKKLVIGKDVRACLMYADRGEVDGAFVYRTDALQAKKAKILFTVPQALYTPVVYPMAVTTSGARNADAVGFWKYLQSQEAQGVLSRYGFRGK